MLYIKASLSKIISLSKIKTSFYVNKVSKKEVFFNALSLKLSLVLCKYDNESIEH